MIANIIIMILSAIGAVSTGVLVGGLLRYKADEKKRTNGDRIRSMTDEELAWILMCPYDTAGEPEEIMPCVRDGRTSTGSESQCGLPPSGISSEQHD